MTVDKSKIWLSAVLVSLILTAPGCQTWQQMKLLYEPPAPQRGLGSINDTIWKSQEANAEASKYVIYEHEFKLNSPELNKGGENHLLMIAARIERGQEAPVIVEQSTMGIDPTSEYQYPVNPDPELDVRRRQVVVTALTRLNVKDADSRVVIAPALAAGSKATEDERAYQRAFSMPYQQYGGGYGGYGHPNTYGGGAYGPFTGW